MLPKRKWWHHSKFDDVTASQGYYTFIANAVVHTGAKIAEPVTIFAAYHHFLEKRDFIYFMMTSSIFLQKNVAEMFLDCWVTDLPRLFAILCTNIQKNEDERSICIRGFPELPLIFVKTLNALRRVE